MPSWASDQVELEDVSVVDAEEEAVARARRRPLQAPLDVALVELAVWGPTEMRRGLVGAVEVLGAEEALLAVASTAR